ncbi:uncharacterized protein LOC141647887 [Silene latifolia]|uniref:uncharacterized protein LOC141647887 n=1 Tax=Silene latifolia TaxID=37657 RepID=UPI003D772DF2
MLPFAQNIQNQSSSSSVPPRASAPLHPQVPGTPSNIFPNLVQMQPQMGFINPQLSNPFNNNINNNNNGFNLNMVNGGRPQGFMNMPNFNPLQQNSLLGSLQALQQQCQPQPGFCQQNSGFMGNGQLGNMGQNMIPGNMNPGLGNFGGWQNQGQNMNQLGGVMLNPAQVAALSQLMGCVNQVAQGMVSQNAPFLGNPQLGLVQPSGGLQQQGNFPPQLQNGPAMPFNPAMAQPQHNQTPNLQNQGSYSKNQGMHISNARHNQNSNFVNNPRRDASNLWSPKPKHQQMNKGGKGMESADPKNSANQNKTEKRKPLFLLYTDKEIQKWREERKKNYPTKDIVQKKLSQKQANADAADEEAKLRRQQLKEVLAKQVELGFDVPEIPSHYMLDDENVSHGKGRNKRQVNNGRHQNRFNKRGKFDRNNRFPPKRNTDDNNHLSEDYEHSATKLKEGENKGRKTPIKEPSLMQKLLSADMKRDNNRLLQAFRFMTMNSFFMDKTEEPLSFPTVVVKETGDVNNDESSLKELIGSVEAHGDCQEEGEITD